MSTAKKLSSVFASPPSSPKQQQRLASPGRRGPTREREPLLPSFESRRWFDKERRQKQWLLEIFAGCLTYFFMTVFVVTYAATVSGELGFGTKDLARSSVLSYFVCGGVYVLLTRMPYAMPIGPDLAVAPMMAQVAGAIGASYKDRADLDALACVLTVSAVSAAIAGGAMALMSQYGLLRFAEYLPFPVVAGLLAATGFGLIHSAVHLALPGLFSCLAAVLVAFVDFLFYSRRASPPLRFTICVLLPTVVVNVISHQRKDLFFPKRIFGADALRNPPPLVSALYAALFRTKESGEYWRPGLAMDALSAALEPALAVILLTILKAPVVDAAVRKALVGVVATENQKDMPLGRLTKEKYSSARRGLQKEENTTAREMTLLGTANVMSLAIGASPVIGQSVSMSVVNKGVGSKPESKVPAITCLVLTALSTIWPFLVACRVPRFVFAGLIASSGSRLVERWLVQPAAYLPRPEVGVTVVISTLTLVRGFATGVAAGAAASVLLFAYASIYAPIVKYVATGLTFRSNIDRDPDDRAILDAKGDALAIVVLTGLLFFGNGIVLLAFVDALLDDDDDDDLLLTSAQHQQQGPHHRRKKKKKPTYLVLDCGLCLGADASAVDAIIECGQKVNATHDPADLLADGPALYLANTPDKLRLALRRRPRVDQTLKFAPDADKAFGACENRLIAQQRIKKRSPPEEKRVVVVVKAATQKTTTNVAGILDHYEPPHPEQKPLATLKKPGMSDFGEALRHSVARTALVDAFDGSEIIDRLEAALGPRSRVVRLGEGQTLMAHSKAGDPVDRDDSLYIVARGRIDVRHDPSQSTGGHLGARSLSYSSMVLASRRRHSRSLAFRLTQLGPGSLIGVEELATRVRSVGVFAASGDDCLLHRITFKDIDDLISEDPLLGVSIFRFVSAVLADDASNLKARLSTTVDAFYSKPLRQPMSRRTLRSFALTTLP